MRGPSWRRQRIVIYCRRTSRSTSIIITFVTKLIYRYKVKRLKNIVVLFFKRRFDHERGVEKREG